MTLNNNMADSIDPWVGTKATFSLLNNKTVASISSDWLLLLYTAHYYTGFKKKGRAAARSNRTHYCATRRSVTITVYLDAQ